MKKKLMILNSFNKEQFIYLKTKIKITLLRGFVCLFLSYKPLRL